MRFNGDLYGIPTGWWYTYLSEKYDLVSWDDEIPDIYGKKKVMFQTTNQYGIPSGNLVQFAIENGPFTGNLHSKNGDCP